MDRNSAYFRFWVRGLWVFLMLLITNIFLGLVAAAIGSIVRGLSGAALWWSYLLMMLTIGLPFMGWIFEKFASRLPRLPVAESPRDVAG
jgi:ABC-type glycerol-3-phosphate transport system permease component